MLYSVLLLFLVCLPQVGFSAADSVTDLKLVEAGVPKENFVLLSIPMIPIQIVLPLYISRYTAGTVYISI